MNINCCTGLFVLFFLYTTKVRTGEVPEEERGPEHVEDTPFRTQSLENNTSPTAAAPVLPMSPYPYNFYYPNPYALFSPLMYNYHSSPYLQSLQHSVEPSLQTTYPLNAAGYPIKVTQKFLNGEERLQDMDTQVPSFTYTSFHNNRPSHPVEIPSSDKNNLKQSQVPQPPSQTSFFQGQSVSLANNTETPAVNVNSISLQSYRWPSFASEKPSATNIMHTTLPSISGGSFESATQPANHSFEKETRSLVMDTATIETIPRSNNSVNTQENQILPFNSSSIVETLSSEETHPGVKSAILPNFPNEGVMNSPVSDSFKNEIISSNLHSTADISGDKHKQSGAISSNRGTYLAKEIPAAGNILEGKQSQNGPKRKSMEVTSESIKSGNEHNNQLSDIKGDIPNTLVVQISTVHNDRTIEAPQVDPSGNIILFPMSSLMQKARSINNIPLQQQHHHHQTYFSRSSSVQNNDNKGNSILEQNGQEPTSVTDEKNHQIGRRNKVLNVTTLNSKEEQEDTTLQQLSTENESTKERNISLPVRTTNRNIVIRLPSGQELVIDLSHARDTHKNGSSGSDSDEVPLGGAPNEQHKQQTHSLETILSEEFLPGNIKSEDENVLSRAENDIESTMPNALQEWNVPETQLLTPKQSSPEQNVNLSTFNNLNSFENSATASVQEYIRTAEGLENADTKHASDGNMASSVIEYLPQRYSLPIPEDGQLNKDSSIHWSASPTKPNTQNMPTSPVRHSNIKIEIVQKPRSVTHSFS